MGLLIFIFSGAAKWILYKTIFVEGFGVLDTKITEVEAKFPGRILNIKSRVNDEVSLNDPIVFLDRSGLENQLEELQQNEHERVYKVQEQLKDLEQEKKLLHKQIEELKLTINDLQSDFQKTLSLVNADLIPEQSIPKTLSKTFQLTREVSKLIEEINVNKQEIEHSRKSLKALRQEEENIKQMVQTNVLTRSHLKSIQREAAEIQNKISLKNIKAFSHAERKKILIKDIQSLFKNEIQKSERQLTELLLNLNFNIKRQNNLTQENNRAQKGFVKKRESLTHLFEDGTLYSPLNGFVLHIDKQIGEVVLPGESVMRIGDKTHWHVKAFFEQDQLKNIKLGEKVEIFFASGESSSGTITHFHPITLPWPEEYKDKFGNPGSFIVAEIAFTQTEILPKTLKSKAKVRINRFF